jgi:hypothetical protein
MKVKEIKKLNNKLILTISTDFEQRFRELRFNLSHVTRKMSN